MTSTNVKSIEVASIRQDGQTQTRSGLDASHVEDIAEAMSGRDSHSVPPVTVFHDGKSYWLADGFHRVAAARKLGRKKIMAAVHAGTVDDAGDFACQANRAHGLKRSNADKRRAVESMLRRHEDWPDNTIAKHVGVSNHLVADVRSSLGEFQGEAARSAGDFVLFISEAVQARAYVGEGDVGKDEGFEHPSYTPGEWDELRQRMAVHQPSPEAIASMEAGKKSAWCEMLIGRALAELRLSFDGDQAGFRAFLEKNPRGLGPLRMLSILEAWDRFLSTGEGRDDDAFLETATRMQAELVAEAA